jgi:excinuclease ABC subunit C
MILLYNIKSMESATLKKCIQQLPHTAGVYVFHTPRRQQGKHAGTPLYIGKATHLKNRVSNYLQPKDNRIATMVKAAVQLTFIETRSDIEALILESQLIKKYRPKFNVMLRDDKQYFYIKLTPAEFPRIILTHQPSTHRTGWPEAGLPAGRQGPHWGAQGQDPAKSGLGEVIGPFTDGTALKATLRILRRIFPYCTCTQKHHVRCLNAHIGKCLGDCCLKKPVSDRRREYAHNIRAIRDILSGKRTSLVRRLTREMKILATQGHLERAAKLQRTIAHVQRVFENARIVADMPAYTTTGLEKIIGTRHTINRIEGYDIANIQGQHAVGAMVVFENGVPVKSDYRMFRIKTSGGDTNMLHEILTRRMRHKDSADGETSWPLPDLVIIDGGKAQLSTALATFNKHTPIIALTKDDRHHGTKLTYKKSGSFHELPLTDLPPQTRNLILAVDAESHRFAISHYRHLHRSRLNSE